MTQDTDEASRRWEEGTPDTVEVSRRGDWFT